MVSSLPTGPGSTLVQLILPARCPGCAARAVALCPACQRLLIPAPLSPPPPGVEWWAAAFAYHGPARALVAAAKYRGARAGWAWLASELAGRISGAEGAATLELVTWPPTTAARRRQRGFDQAQWLARRVARELALPARGLLHRRPGPAQTGRDRRARAESGPTFTALALRPGTGVLVVDDVATTGATLAAAAAALRSAGAGLVAAATAARTPFNAAQK